MCGHRRQKFHTIDAQVFSRVEYNLVIPPVWADLALAPPTVGSMKWARIVVFCPRNPCQLRGSTR